MEPLPGRHRPSLRQALWGTLLSLVLPGLGQAYAWHFRAAAGFALASLLLSLAGVAVSETASPTAISLAELGTVVGLTVLSLVLSLAAAAHAWGVLRRPGTREGARPAGWRFSPWVWAGGLLVLAAAEVAAPGIDWQGYQVPSGSMHPTLLEGDRFLAVAGPAVRDDLRAGDVIVFHLPRDPAVIYVKRLIALPGQSVQMRAGRLFIDGTEVPHESLGPADTGPAGEGLERWRMTLPDGYSYIALKHPGRPYPLDNTPLFHLGPDQLFVMGDNIDDSLDSRATQDGVGLLPRGNVEGRASVIFWSRHSGRIGSAVR